MGAVIRKHSPVVLAPLAAALMLLALAAGSARAAGCAISWTGGDNSTAWGDPGNWSTDTIPNSTDDVCINNNANVTVVISGPGTAQAKSLQLGVGSTSGTQTLEINGAAPTTLLDLQNDATIGSTGDLKLMGSADSGIGLVNGTLTNAGTLTAAATGTNITREITGSLTNSGTFNVDGNVAFDKAGAALIQTGGTTAMAPNTILDTSSAGTTFQLQGGALSGGGQTQSNEAIINGSLSNTGGNITPGSASTPGLMTFDGAYTQGSGGKLTIPVNGAGGPSGVGTHYSQLAAAGNITLGGTLAIHTVSKPAVNDLDTILATTGTRSGTFATVTGGFTAGSTFGYKPTYGSNNAALEVGAALQVKKSGPGTGSVTSSPSGINCGGQCDTPFFQQNVTLTAHPGNGSAFGGWSGGCTGSKNTCQVSLTQARTVTAKFLHSDTTSLSSSRNPAKKGKKVTYTATVTPHPGGGTVKFTSNGSTISGCGSVAVSTSTGKATCSVTYHSTGSRKIQAAYSGNSTFARSVSTTLTEKVTS